jgi:4-hydroxy-3-methylbut-2-enyl diphosphate reductase
VQRRQASVREVAEQNEVVVIIGDKKSKNTDELHRISKAINSKTYFVQNTSELRGSWFKGIDSVGIETGTSAAPWTIEEIVEAVKRFDE